MTENHLQIKALFEQYLAENDKFENGGVKAAATRARKALGELGKLTKERRKENLQPCGVGEAVTSPGFNLPAEHLVHVVGPDCRRPSQDNFRRELLKNSYDALFEQVEKIEPRETLVLPPLGMDVFAYPHREGARKTMEIILEWMDGEDDPGVRMVLIVTHEDNFLNNMKTVYREGEDQLPGIESTRDFRKGKFE